MAWTTVNDLRTFYTSSGRGGRPIVLVHGWCDDSTGWTRLIADLEPDHLIIAPDLRGHGHSESIDGSYTPFVMADDVQALLEQLSVTDAVVVGHSLGGLVASIMGVQRPDLASQLVLLDPSYGREHGHADRVREWIGDIHSADSHERAMKFVSRATGDSPTVRARRVARRRRAEAMSPDVIWRALADIHLASDQISTRPESSRYLVRREIPILAIHADRSRADWERSLVRHPTSRVEYWPDVSHWVHEDAPERLVATMRDWLSDVDTYRRTTGAGTATSAASHNTPRRQRPRDPIIDVCLHVGIDTDRTPALQQSPTAAEHVLDECGIAAAILSPYGSNLSRGVVSAQADNNMIAAAVADRPDRFPLALAGADLRLGAATAAAEANRALAELGLAGLSLHLRPCGLGPDQTVHRLLSEVERHRGLCLLHADRGMAPALLDCTGPFSEVTFIVAHASVLDDSDTLRALVDRGNVYLDTSQPVANPSAERLRHLVDKVGSERLLFGGGSPECRPATQRATLDDAGLPADAYERIAWRNALGIIHKYRPNWDLG